MKCIVMPALAVAAIVGTFNVATATESLDEQIAALEKENATLKKVMRLQSLQKENAELRKRVEVTTRSEPRAKAIEPETVKSVGRRNTAEVAADAMAYAPGGSSASVTKGHPPEQPFVRRWAGPYVGGHAGMGFGNWNSMEVPSSVVAGAGGSVLSENMKLNALGAVAGGQVGYSWQLSHLIFGVEADVSVSSVGATAPRNIVVNFGAGIGGVTAVTTQTADASVDWLSSFRGRLGVASNNWLFFGSGGLAVAGITNVINSYTAPAKVGKTITGYAVGGGLAYALSPQLAFRAEYLRYQFPDTVQAVSPGGPVLAGTPSTSLSSINASTNVIRGGLDWRFN